MGCIFSNFSFAQKDTALTNAHFKLEKTIAGDFNYFNVDVLENIYAKYLLYCYNPAGIEGTLSLRASMLPLCNRAI